MLRNGQNERATSLSTRSSQSRRPAGKQAARSETVIDGLRRQYDQLTQSQKRIAEHIVNNPHSVAFATVDQMGAELGINPSTIVRFAYRLGLKGFPDLQERARHLVRGQLTAASEIVNEKSILSHLEGTTFGASLAQDMENVTRTISNLSVRILTDACDMIVRAERVHVVGAFASYSVAYYLALALDRIRGNTRAWNGEDGMFPSRLLNLSKTDCLIAFSAAPYATVTHRIVQYAKEAGARVIAVTDTPISGVGQFADVVISAAFTGSGSQNSLVAPMAVAHALL